MNILLVLRQPPYASLALQEGLDMALILAVMGYDVSICLSQEACWLLQEGQDTTLAGRRDLYRLLASLPLYDIQHCYVEAEGCPLGSLPPPWQALGPEQMQDILSEQQEIIYW